MRQIPLSGFVVPTANVIVVSDISPIREFKVMKNESFWLPALLVVILAFAALEVRQSNSASETQSQASSSR